MTEHKPVSLMAKILGIFRQRCPRCLEGQVFESTWKTHQTCPKCNLIFEREPGYFTGAMYLSYGMAVFAALPAWGLMLFLEIPGVWTMPILAVLLIMISPLLFRYSRIIWLYIDQTVFPR